MGRYALIRDGVVVTVARGDAVWASEQEAAYDHVVESETASPGDDYDGTTFSASSTRNTSLSVTLSTSQAATGETVTGTIAVRKSDGTLVPVSGTYYVPVLDVDGTKASLLTVTVTDGEGTTDFSLADPGIYTLRTDLIRPKPNARLAQAPELIVT